jgi:hypothetical protein
MPLLPRPHTRGQYLALPAAQRRGFGGYGQYVNWWDRTVKPRIKPPAGAAPQVAATAAPPPPGGTAVAPPQERTGRFVHPDYQALIAGDPTRMAAIGQIAASGAEAGRQKMNAIRQAIVRFGAMPNAPGVPTGDIDEATLTAAQQNPLSTMRQLGETRERGRADLAAELASRGILQSGALTGGEQMVQTGYERGVGGATNQLLEALQGYEGAHAAAKRELELAQLQAEEAAAARIMGTYEPDWVYDQPWEQAPPTVPAPTMPPPTTVSAPPAMGQGPPAVYIPGIGYVPVSQLGNLAWQ